MTKGHDAGREQMQAACMSDGGRFVAARIPVKYLGQFGQHNGDEPCPSLGRGSCPCRSESMAAASGERIVLIGRSCDRLRPMPAAAATYSATISFHL
jgi:hypothetical protein